MQNLNQFGAIEIGQMMYQNSVERKETFKISNIEHRCNHGKNISHSYSHIIWIIKINQHTSTIKLSTTKH